MDLRFQKSQQTSPVRVMVDSLVELDGSGTPYQTGIRLLVEVTAGSREEALLEAGSFANAVLSTLAFVSGVGVPVARPQSVLQLEEEPSGYAFTQFFDLNAPQPSRGDASSAVVIRAFDGMHTLAPDRFSRVGRALQELRSGQGETDVVDRFLHYWMGLEALNPLFAADLRAESETTRCRACGAENRVESSNGVRAFFEARVTDGLTMYRRMRSIRVLLAHGLRGIDDNIVAEARELSPVARQALRLAIASFVSLPADSLKETGIPISNVVPVRGMISGHLRGAGPEQLGPHGGEPHFDVENKVLTIETKPDGGINVTFQTILDARLGEDVSATMNVWGVSGEDITITGGTFEKRDSRSPQPGPP